VEGTADVKNLLKQGIKNAIALGGTSVPDKIPEIVEDRIVTAFLDGDRGGDLILEELKSGAEPDFVARAPEDYEVEELKEKQVYEALRDKEKLKYTDGSDVEKEELGEDEKRKVMDSMNDLVATRALNVLDTDYDVLGRSPVDRTGSLDAEEGYIVLADGEIDENIVSLAEDLGAEYVVGRGKSGTVNSSKVSILTDEELTV